MFIRCPHCTAKIDETTTLKWFTECEMCGSDFPPHSTQNRENAVLTIWTSASRRDSIRLESVCDSCAAAVTEMIGETIKKLSENKRKVVA
jgi:hypothetical protein